MSTSASEPWLHSFPGHMPVPTMLSRTEIDYLHWLASSRYSASGRIVDLGCFFGGSTMPLVMGLEAKRVASPRTILTYDSFVMDADTAPRFPVGLGDGESFRPVFETYLREHLDRITIREGWIPSEFDERTAKRLYPEQEPVEILFIDLAKRWPVHETILRTFGPHLIPGTSVVVQQDFKHHGTYWLGLHMYQLRECFEPLHDVTGGATVSYLYRGGIESKLGGLWSRKDATVGEWNAVDRYWAARRAVSIRLVMRLAAATHMADVGLVEDAVEHLGLFESEFGQVRGDGEAGLLRGEFAAAAQRLARATGHPEAHRMVADARGPREEWRSERRLAAIDRLVEAGHRVIALYGAGRHTMDLLQSGWPFGRLSVAAIADDYSIAREVCGVPVVRPEGVPADATAVLVSSDASEEALFEAARARVVDRPVSCIYR